MSELTMANLQDRVGHDRKPGIGFVPEADRLQRGDSFKDTARVLRMTRAGVAWQAVGCARGAYEHTVRYVQQRHQFGRPIGSFQMVQDLVAHMLSQLTAMQALVFR